MALIKQESQPVFDLTVIGRGSCIRILHKGDTTPRNGIVTEAHKGKITVLYINAQNNACSYIDIKAVEVSLGAWEIRWTQDFETVYKEGGED